MYKICRTMFKRAVIPTLRSVVLRPSAIQRFAATQAHSVNPCNIDHINLQQNAQFIDQLSSINIPKGYQIIVYKDDNSNGDNSNNNNNDSNNPSDSSNNGTNDNDNTNNTTNDNNNDKEDGR